MAFRHAPQHDPLAPRRAALYLRVSTGRQAAGDVSIPSQRDLTRRFCEARGWAITEEFVEPGASAIDDRRPAFQRMLDEAISPDRRFDIICVHAFSRFYRNGAEMELHARLARNNPKVTPPRVVNGPTLLTGIATCATCGAGMTRTGTRRRGRSYSYYSCAGCHQKGKSVCRGRHVPMAKLDSIIIENVKERLFTPERLTTILETLLKRQSANDRAVQDRRAALTAELAAKGEKLKRLYRAIEDGVIDLDGHLKERIETLKTERDITRASLDRIAIQAETRATITRDPLEAFSKLMREKLDTGDTRARKAYLQSVISQIEVDDDKVRIIGDKPTLAAVIAGRQNQTAQVRGFVRKWRARRD